MFLHSLAAGKTTPPQAEEPPLQGLEGGAGAKAGGGAPVGEPGGQEERSQSMQGWEKVMGFPLVGGGARASPSSLGPQAVVGGWRHNGQSRCINGEVMMALARTIRGTLVSMHEGQPDGEARIRERMQCP